MPQTYWDMGLRERDESWRLIRQARSSTVVSSGDRATYTSALEQAEQLFGAAEHLGPATRALPLFYGLSQAARAVAVVIEPGARLNGHGIKHTVAGGKPLSLAAIATRGLEQEGSSFGTLSRLLDSSPMKVPQPLPYLWGMVQETQYRVPRFPTKAPCLAVGTRGLGIWDVSGVPSSGTETDEDVHSRLVRTYPGLQDSSVGRLAGQVVGDTTRTIHVTFPEGQSKQIGTDYRGGQVLLPSVGGEPATLHPLMLWWALLFSLSMLTRYEPDRWAGLTDINANEDAIHVETLMTYALDTVPDLICRTLVTALDR